MIRSQPGPRQPKYGLSSPKESRMPGDLFMERRIRSLIRYNAIAQVIRNNRANPGLGGHIASFMSAMVDASLAGSSPAR